MHYKNGRPAAIGDWVVGPTHNSEGNIVVGKVLELMAGQGPCNARLHVYRTHGFSASAVGDERSGEDVMVGTAGEQRVYRLGGQQDFADCAELVHALDGFRMVSCQPWLLEKPPPRLRVVTGMKASGKPRSRIVSISELLRREREKAAKAAPLVRPYVQGFADRTHRGVRRGPVHLFDAGNEWDAVALCGRRVQLWNFEGETNSDFCPRCLAEAAQRAAKG